MIHKRATSRNEEGLVAIVVTMIIMLILTLIVTGFAQLARREQREALDRQLAAQATYAAESGINIGKKLLKDNGGNYPKPDCKLPEIDDTKIDSITDANVEVTCLLIKTKLDNLRFNNIQQNKSTISPIFPSGASMDRLIINWQNAEGDNNIATWATTFPNGRDWNTPVKRVGILRIELVPATASSREDQRNQSYVFYARPRTGAGAGGETDYSTDPQRQGEQVPAQCNPGNKLVCQVAVTNLSATNYYIRMTALYNPADAYLCGGSGSNVCNRSIFFDQAQAEIDSTGRANDVLKRIQVRTNAVPNYNGSRNIAEFSLDSADSICKLNSVWPGGGNPGTCP